MRKTLAVSAAVLAWLTPVLVSAHGFGQRIDLPVPLYLYMFGGGAVVALSFILLGLLPTRVSEALYAYPRSNLSKLSWFRAISSPIALKPLRVVLVVVLIASTASGLFGTQSAAFNLLPTVVWILFAIGITFTTAFFGNIWSVINPFKTLYEYAEALLAKFGVTWKPVMTIEGQNVWPAIVFFFGFRWIENVSLMSANPQFLGACVLFYSILTFAGMAVFGKNEWLTKADPFSVFFGFLSRFSITESRKDDGKSQVYLRPPAVGLLNHSATKSETLFVLLMLSSVAADGMLTTPLFQNTYSNLLGFGLPWFFVGTLGLGGLFFVFAVVYYVFSFLTKVISGDSSSTIEVAQRFVFSLLPISIAYEVAHYISILVIEGQRVLYLISDPFGLGWNLFGTAHYQISYTALNLKFLWNIQVALIVIGHVIAVLIAHTIANRFFKDGHKTLVSQYPMLALMVFYSCLSLWIMAQPIVAAE